MSNYLEIEDVYRGYRTVIRYHYRGGHSYAVFMGEEKVLSSGPQPYSLEQAIIHMKGRIDELVEGGE